MGPTFDDLLATIRSVGADVQRHFPRQTSIIWHGIKSARESSSTIDEALPQFRRGENDFGLLANADRLLALLQTGDLSFPDRAVDAMEATREALGVDPD